VVNAPSDIQGISNKLILVSKEEFTDSSDSEISRPAVNPRRQWEHLSKGIRQEFIV